MSKKLVIGSFLTLLVDQVIKFLISKNFSLYESVSIIPNFFSITYVRNDGAAWSIFSGNILFLIGISLVALFLIYWYFIKGKKLSMFESICYSLLLGGIVGNLVDRILLGYVVDYLEFNFWGYHFPIFNFADVGIVLSVFGLLFFSWKEEYLCKKSK